MRWSSAVDGELLGAARREPEAFMAFYERYEAAVIGFHLRRVGEVELAVDLASETFAAALAAASRYRSEGDSAAPWLFTIAHNVLVDSIRRGRVEERARRRLGIRDAVVYEDDELERIEALVGQPSVASRLLEGLPAQQREAVRAHVVHERGYGEIARELSTSELVVRKRVSRGLKALRDRIEEEAS